MFQFYLIPFSQLSEQHWAVFFQLPLPYADEIGLVCENLQNEKQTWAQQLGIERPVFLD